MVGVVQANIHWSITFWVYEIEIKLLFNNCSIINYLWWFTFLQANEIKRLQYSGFPQSRKSTRFSNQVYSNKYYFTSKRSFSCYSSCKTSSNTISVVLTIVEKRKNRHEGVITGVWHLHLWVTYRAVSFGNLSSTRTEFGTFGRCGLILSYSWMAMWGVFCCVDW